MYHFCFIKKEQNPSQWKQSLSFDELVGIFSFRYKLSTTSSSGSFKGGRSMVVIIKMPQISWRNLVRGG